MKTPGSESAAVQRRVHVLNDAVARKIAAGEVIDRPYAAVRELLDNAIDAGAVEITLALQKGGIDEIRVTDDGFGMDRADLDVCWLPHATSKIAEVDDLERIATLGFRGEALSSLAACSRLEIVTSRDGDPLRLSVHGGKALDLSPHAGAPGTTVSVKDLFFNMPARRRFLKSPRAEGTLCRRIFLEKAAAHPHLTFRLFVDGVLKLYFPSGTPAQRIAAAWPRIVPGGACWQTEARGDGFSVTVVHARPEVSRKDRQYIQIYANRRRIDEFSLVQAVAYAYDPWMPGGAFPVAFVFIEMDPALVDFNIHPAKKEARFRDPDAVRHRLIEAVKDRLTRESYRNRADSAGHAENGAVQGALPGVEAARPAAGRSGAPGNAGSDKSFPAYPSAPDRPPSGSGSPAASRPPLPYSGSPKTGGVTPRDAEAFAESATRLRRDRQEGRRLRRFEPAPPGPAAGFRYLGQVMGVFLAAERNGSLFIVDQHAAHERILYERFRKAGPETEGLLIPRSLDLDRKALMRLELRQDRLKQLGIEVGENDDGGWELRTMPREARGLEDAVVSFIESGAGDAEGLEKALWADLACKAAVKDNSILDEAAARRLLEDAFALETPRCPHGRPLWFEISREELFELVGRTV